FADGNFERIPALAAELVRLKVDVVVTHVTVGIQALKRESKTLPIVAASITNPISSGFAVSLARPGGNITGISNVSGDLTLKRIELLMAMVPKLSRLAVLLNSMTPTRGTLLKSVQDEAKRFGIKVLPADASNQEEIER